MSKDTQTAIVEGLDVSAYGIVRSLGRCGVASIAINHSSTDFLRFSRYCRGFHLYPGDSAQARTYDSDVVPDEGVLLNLLLDWGSQLDEKPVLFASSDWFTRFLCNRQDELSPHFLFHWLPPDLYETITEKGRMAEFCDRAGVLVPRTHVTQPGDDIAQIARAMPFPCLVKPVHRQTVAFPVAGKVFVARDREQLESFYAAHPQVKGATLIQEIIEGGDDEIFQCTALVKSSGEVGAYATVRKLHQYPPRYGSMCNGRTERNEEVAAEGLKLLRALGYRGLGSIEFKRRARDGGYYFIEMNTRLPWYNGLFDDAGVNLAYLAFLDLTGQPDGPALRTTRQRQVSWVSFRNYSATFRAMRQEQAMSAWRWLASVAGARSYAWWNWRDPAPFLVSTLYRAGARALHAAHLR